METTLHRPGELWRSSVYLAVGALFIAGYFVLDRPFGLAYFVPKIALYGSVSASAAIAILYAVVRYRPERRAAWLLIAANQLVYAAAGFTFYTYHYVLKDLTFPGPADALYLAHYPFLVAGLLLLRGRRRSTTGTVIDTLIVGTAAALIVWIFLMDPYARDFSLSTLVRLTSLAFPVMDLMVLVVTVRLFAGGLRARALYPLGLAMTLLICTDFTYGLMQINGTYKAGSFVDGAWMSYYLLLGASALHPSMRELGTTARIGSLGVRGPRLLLLTFASLVAPVMLLSEALVGRRIDTLPIAVASIVLFLLVVARLADVARGQRRALRNLEAARREKEKLLARSLEVAEHERMRVAIDLHDGPIQRLTAVTLRLDLIASRIRKGDLAGAQEYVEEARADLAAEMAEIRRLMTELRPPVLDEGGLPAALQDCALQVLEGASIRANVASKIEPVRLAPELETALYRIAREALQNVRKHSHASDVQVSLTAQNGHLRLVVRDNGEGFDLREPGGQRLGLLGMREMAEGLGGSCRFVSTRANGTTVEVLVPRKEALPSSGWTERSATC